MKWNLKMSLQLAGTIFLLFLSVYYWPNIVSMIRIFLGASMPLIAGGMIAYVINILMCWYERNFFTKWNCASVNKMRRPVCLVLAFVTLFLVAAVVICQILPQLIACVRLILAELPLVLEDAAAWIKQLDVLPKDIAAAISEIDRQNRIGQILRGLTSGLGNVVDVLFSLVSSVFSRVMTVVMGLIFAIYLLLGKEILRSQLHRIAVRYVKPELRERLSYILRVTNECFHKYIVGQCTEAVILGLLCTIGMILLKLPYAAMIGSLVGFTALIPVAGAYIGAVVGTFMILTVSPVQAVIFLIYLVVLQQVEGNLIYPKVVGASMGLPAIWVLAAVTIGGGVMGIPGMLLGVPLAATVYRLVKDDVERGTVQIV